MTHVGMDPSLDALFAPRSIAVVGASSNPKKVAGLPVRFLREQGYGGHIYPVNPAQTEVQGLRAYPTLSAINEPVDLAVLSVGAAAVREVLEDAVRAGVRAAVVFASGFAETGGEGACAQHEMVALAREHGIRLLGPNCLGLMNVNLGAYATFSPVLLSGAPRPGNVAIVSQSGAFGVFALVRARKNGIGVSVFASTGNEGDIDVADCIAYLARDERTKVIAAYLEGTRDGAKLAAALELARRHGKAVVVCKSGSSALGAQAAASHTAALAGRDEVFDAVFQQHGAYRAQDIDELFDVAYACSIAPLPRSRRLGILSMSGGAGVTLADAAQAWGLQVPELDDTVKQRILERVPFAGVLGPIDLTGRTLDDTTLFSDAVDWVVDTGRYDSIVSFQAVTGITPEHRPILMDTWTTVRRKHPELPVAVVSVFDDETRAAIEALGCLAFEEPSRAVRALAALARFRESFDRPAPVLPALDGIPQAPAGVSSEHEVLALLAAAGIPVVEHQVASNAAAAFAAARSMRFPVAVKVLSPDVVHKSDVGGVALGLGSAQEVEQAFEAITSRVRQARPDARMDGVLVAPMVSGGVECILGAMVDPAFGPVVMFGLGGVLVEVLKDVTFRRAPIDIGEARRMICETRACAVLDGVRGRPPSDVDALAEAISRLSLLIAANASRVTSIEVNPFIVLERGRGGLAVDGLVIGAA